MARHNGKNRRRALFEKSYHISEGEMIVCKLQIGKTTKQHCLKTSSRPAKKHDPQFNRKITTFSSNNHHPLQKSYPLPSTRPETPARQAREPPACALPSSLIPPPPPCPAFLRGGHKKSPEHSAPGLYRYERKYSYLATLRDTPPFTSMKIPLAGLATRWPWRL